MPNLFETLLTLYLGGALYAVLDITATCRMAESQGRGISPAGRRQALLDAALWPVALPGELLVGYFKGRGQS